MSPRVQVVPACEGADVAYGQTLSGDTPRGRQSDRVVLVDCVSHPPLAASGSKGTPSSCEVKSPTAGDYAPFVCGSTTQRGRSNSGVSCLGGDTEESWRPAHVISVRRGEWLCSTSAVSIMNCFPLPIFAPIG